MSTAEPRFIVEGPGAAAWHDRERAHAEDQAQTPARRPLAPLAQQLDMDGRLHDLTPQTRQERLFEPAPFAQLEGQQYLDTERREQDR